MSDSLARLLAIEIDRLTTLAQGDLDAGRRTRASSVLGDDAALIEAAVALFEIVAARAAIDSTELARGREWLAAASSSFRFGTAGPLLAESRYADDRPVTAALLSDALFTFERVVDAISAPRPPSTSPPSTSPPPRAFVLTVGLQGCQFAVDGGPIVNLRRRPTLGRLLWALAVSHGTPNPCMSPDEVVAAVWPNEKIAAAAAKNRLYFAVHTIRALGLRDVILSRDGGYVIPHYVDVRLEPPRSSDPGEDDERRGVAHARTARGPA